jgi:glycolate oxidase FAD binding subunit
VSASADGSGIDLDDSLGALRTAVGDAALLEHPAVRVDDCELSLTLRPPDAESLARALAMLSERRLSVVVRGGATRLGLGNRPRGPRLLLSTEALVGIDEFDPEDGVVHAAAGTPLQELRKRVNAAGWEVALEAASDRATVGGVLASAAIGPRRLGFGAPRDCVLGLSLALASGERTRCGGRVVKNVTGYDLAKLYTGSIGTLGVIESAWLRLRPLPQTRRALVAELAAPEPGRAAFALGLEAARRASAQSVALVSPGLAQRVGLAAGAEQPGRSRREGAWLLVAEYAGDESLVARDLEWLDAQGSEAGARPEGAGSSAVDGIRDLQASGGVRARIAVLPSRLERTCAPLLEAGVELIAHPGLALVYVIASARDATTTLAAVDAAVEAGAGDLLVEELPAAVKRGRDVFGDPGDRLPLMRALKQRFDPAGTLNPGRFQGCL